jgi:hypothetical protein
MGSRVFGTVLALVGCAAVAGAQESPRTWLGAGVTAAGFDDGGGIGGLAEIVHQRGPHHFVIRGMFATNAEEHSGVGTVEELGVQYGRARRGSRGHAAIAAGLAFTWLDQCEGATGPGCSTLGVPVTAEAALRVSRYVGLGVQAFGNLNSKTSYGGAAAFVQLGWMP